MKFVDLEYVHYIGSDVVDEIIENNNKKFKRPNIEFKVLDLINDNLPKEIDCTYSQSRTLYHISDIINHLDGYKVDIKINESGIGKEYTGKFTDLGINYIGLEKGIETVYNKLK
jgi:hypothetical protein